MMLEIWLDTDYNATWDKIREAIKCPGVTKLMINFQQNGMYVRVHAHAYAH